MTGVEVLVIHIFKGFLLNLVNVEDIIHLLIVVDQGEKMMTRHEAEEEEDWLKLETSTQPKSFYSSPGEQ